MKHILVSMLALLPATLLAQEKPFVLKGKIGTLGAPAKLFLTYRVDGNTIRDSAALENGAFEFKGKVGDPIKANLVLRHTEPTRMMSYKTDFLEVYLEKGTITITGKDSVYNAVVKGTSLNADQQELRLKLQSTGAQRDQLLEAYIAASAETRNTPEFKKNYEDKSKAIREEEKGVYRAFVGSHPTSLVSLDALLNSAGSIPENPAQLESTFNGLSAGVKDSKHGKEVAKLIKGWKETAIGAIAPVFTQNDTLGKPVNLTDFRGKYVLVDFWASWCGPCRAENPHVVAAYNKYKNHSFTILGVSLDQPNGHDAWLKAIHTDQLTWTHVSDLKFWDNDVAKLYSVRAVPQNFLLDPTGKIVAKNLRGEDLEKKLAELLPH